MGRPSLYTQELGDKICERLAEGESLLAICRDIQISEGTVRTWVRDHQDFATNYARAREIGDDVEFEKLNEMASERPPTVKGFTDAGWVAWKKNQIDTFKWSLARKRPKKYGDKMQHTGGDGDGPVQFVITRAGSKEK